MPGTLIKTCSKCHRPLSVKFFRRGGRPRRDGNDVLEEACRPCRTDKGQNTWNLQWLLRQEQEWCPICETTCPDLESLSAHMKEQHKRLILEGDLNQQKEERLAKLRAFEETEEALLA